jgi:hypothetical protein
MSPYHERHRPSRVAQLAAVFALILCAFLAPIQSRIWNGPSAPGWINALSTAVAPSSALDHAASLDARPPEVYFAFGRLFILVYASLVLVLARGPLVGSRRTQRLLLGLVAIAAFGNTLAYWLSAWAGSGVRHIGFWRIEVPAIAALLVVMSVQGVIAVRRRTASPLAAWAFALVIPLAAFGTALLRYMPHGPMLAFTLAIVVHVVTRPRKEEAASPGSALEGAR